MKGPEPGTKYWETPHGVKMRMPTASVPYYRIDFTVAGKRTLTSAGTDWKAAWQEATRADALVATSKGLGGKNSFATMCEAWFSAREKRWSATHRKNVRYFLDKVWKPALGLRQVGDLRITDFEDVLEGLDSVSMSDKARNILSSLLGWAGKRQWLSLSRDDLLPDRRVDAVTGLRDVSEDEVPTEHEIELLFDALLAPRVYESPHAPRYVPPAHLAYLPLVAAYVGLRQGECFALRGKDVQGDTLPVTKQVQIVNGKLTDVPVKMNRPRTALVPSNAVGGRVNLAEWLQERAEVVGENGLLFPTSSGKMWRATNYLRQSFTPARIQAWGSLKYTFHDLRHHAATYSLRKGVAPQDIQHQLGHASVRTTLDVYVGKQTDESLSRIREKLSSPAS